MKFYLVKFRYRWFCGGPLIEDTGLMDLDELIKFINYSNYENIISISEYDEREDDKE